MKYLTLFTLTIFAAVCAAQSPGPAAPRAADTSIDVGGRKLLLNCSGEMAAVGGPTVILESGMGNDSSVWSKVQPEVAKFARVCSYDRAGLGKSDTVLDERSIVAPRGRFQR